MPEKVMPVQSDVQSEKSAEVVVLITPMGKDRTKEGNGVIVSANVVQQKSPVGGERVRADRGGTPKGADPC